MLIEAVVLSILIGLVRGGRLSKFRTLRGRSLWFLVMGVLLQVFLSYSIPLTGQVLVNKVTTYYREIYILSLILIGLGIIMNYKHRALWISGIGFIMNFIVIFANGWKMPVLMEGLDLAGRADWIDMIKSGAMTVFTPLIEGINYPSLGKIIIFAKPYPIGNILTIGDIIIGIGLFIFIQDIMFRPTSFMRR